MILRSTILVDLRDFLIEVVATVILPSCTSLGLLVVLLQALHTLDLRQLIVPRVNDGAVAGRVFVAVFIVSILTVHDLFSERQHCLLSAAVVVLFDLDDLGIEIYILELLS